MINPDSSEKLDVEGEVLYLVNHQIPEMEGNITTLDKAFFNLVYITIPGLEKRLSDMEAKTLPIGAHRASSPPIEVEETLREAFRKCVSEGKIDPLPCGKTYPPLVDVVIKAIVSTPDRGEQSWGPEARSAINAIATWFENYHETACDEGRYWMKDFIQKLRNEALE